MILSCHLFHGNCPGLYSDTHRVKCGCELEIIMDLACDLHVIVKRTNSVVIGQRFCDFCLMQIYGYRA